MMIDFKCNRRSNNRICYKQELILEKTKDKKYLICRNCGNKYYLPELKEIKDIK